MSLIITDGTSLDNGHNSSDIFDVNTGIWWHCDDNETTKSRDLPKGVYTREIGKQKGIRKTLCYAQT